MCRSIKKLRHADLSATEQEITEAALQFVRKVSGYRAPSKKNQAIFDQAIKEVATATRKLLNHLDKPSRSYPLRFATGRGARP